MPALPPKADIARSSWSKGHTGTFQETVLYNPSTMNARDFVALIRMAVISFVF